MLATSAEDVAVNGALVADRPVAVDVCQALLYVAVPSVVKEAVLRVGAGFYSVLAERPRYRWIPRGQ